MSREERNEATNKVGPQSIYLSISAKHRRQKKKEQQCVITRAAGLDWKTKTKKVGKKNRKLSVSGK
jgi:hypothetical protein